MLDVNSEVEIILRKENIVLRLLGRLLTSNMSKMRYSDSTDIM